MSYPPTSQLADLLRVAKNHRIDILSWIVYNLGIGMTFIWVSWLLNLYQSSAVGWMDNIMNGSLAVFVLTLTATQAAFFTEVTGQNLRDFNKLGLGLFFILVIVSSVTAAAASSGVARQAMHSQSSPAVIWVSITLLLVSTALCLFLYIVRLASEAGPEGITEERVHNLAQKAASQSEVDGTKL